MISTKLHFKEINWVIYFPATGNKGRPFEKYGVSYRDRDQGTTQPGPKINLDDVLNEKRISENYPHSISTFIDSSGKGKTWSPSYLETRVIRNKTDFLAFLSHLKV